MIPDFGKLDDESVTDWSQMKNMLGILNWLEGKRIFSSFDLKNGFLHVHVEPHSPSKEFTAKRRVLGFL